MTGQLLTIIPPAHEPGSPVRAAGTRVVTADGSEVSGVTKISLVAEVGMDVWRATIECTVDMQRMEGIEGEIVRKPLPGSRPLAEQLPDTQDGGIPNAHQDAYAQSSQGEQGK
jgi:hypothetical protein